MLAAKAAVFGGAALIAGEVLTFISFFAGEAMLHGGVPHVTLATPGVLRAVMMAGAYVCLSGLFGLGLGAIIRNTAGGIAAAIGVIFAMPFLLLPFPDSVRESIAKFLPEQIAASSITAVVPEAAQPVPVGWPGPALPVRRDPARGGRVPARPARCLILTVPESPMSWPTPRMGS